MFFELVALNLAHLLHGNSSSETDTSHLEELRQLGTKKPKTIQCEASNINQLKEFLGKKPVTAISMKDAYAFARWRRMGKFKPGRAVDVSIRTLRHIMAKLVREGVLGVNPVGKWVALARPPAKKRLVPRGEVDALCAASDGPFADYLQLLMLQKGIGYREEKCGRQRLSLSSVAALLHQSLPDLPSGQKNRGTMGWPE